MCSYWTCVHETSNRNSKHTYNYNYRYIPLSALKSISALTSSLEPSLSLLILVVLLHTDELKRLAVELVESVLPAVEVDKLVGCLVVDLLIDLSSSSSCSKTSILDLICSFILGKYKGRGGGNI